MNTTMLRLWTVLVALAATGAVAQDYPPPVRPPHRGDVPPAGFWPTERLLDHLIDRITDEMAGIYGFDEDQLWNTRDTLKARFPVWLQQNRPQIQTLINQYMEAVTAGEPPTPEEVADWAARAQPLLDEFTSLVDETTEEMRGYLTDEQQVILDGQRAAMQVGMNYMRQRLATWKDGGYAWQTEWPRSDAFRAQEQERRKQFEREAERAKLQAMGLPPDTGTAPGAGGAAAAGEGATPGAKPVTPTRPASGTKDEWATYVENFIKRYQLDEAQQNSAHKFLRNQQELRDRYLQKRLTDVKTLEDRQKAAKSDDEKEQVRAEYERLNKPIERYFQRLKERLETLPTRKQRATAAQTEEASRAQAPVSEERKAAMKAEMEARAPGGKPEQPDQAEKPRGANEPKKE